ncbi:MAG: hypothetical protein LBC82_06710 [Oscillospiraceae bacterium]|jgi:hypothetical protein|nr:hypothetical protein [Oscillospiraceae bacterium]
MTGMEKLLKTASLKLGMSPESLMGALEKGDMNSILANMNPSDKQKIKSVLENGTAMEKLMLNPQAAAMMKQMGKK